MLFYVATNERKYISPFTDFGVLTMTSPWKKFSVKSHISVASHTTLSTNAVEMIRPKTASREISLSLQKWLEVNARTPLVNVFGTTNHLIAVNTSK